MRTLNPVGGFPDFVFALWKSNPGGTNLVKLFDAGVPTPIELTPIGDRVLFRAQTLASGTELWQTDGTESGTVLVQDINPGSLPSNPLLGSNPRGLFADSNGRLFFSADDGTHGREPWVYSIAQDADLDGVSEMVEGGAPNGDGNGDGIPDSQQAEVTSLPNSEDNTYVTLAAPTGTTLVGVNAISNPSPLDSPEGISFPVGHFTFTVGGLAPGAATTVTIYLHSGVAVNSYYKYGPTPDDPTPHWYNFVYDGTTGAVFDDFNHTITLYFVDGLRGDDDLTANGVVVDPGSPASTPTAVAQIDIRPQSSANTANVASQGSIAVAILTTATFDATQVLASSVRFANAHAFQSVLTDIDGDGDLDLLLHFRTQDTILRPLYEQLVAEDLNADGVLDSNQQEVSLSLTGRTTDGTYFTGSDDLDLSLSGRALRDLLDDLASSGLI
ncbi:MAG: hypothetical protein L0Z62_27650 [Gemmataceae bacterium]|nr:hypothetical protein [Gemmataceae bacterium]